MGKNARTFGSILAVAAAVAIPLAVSAQAPSGAIFTTVADGTEVNLNQYPSKEAVYLDGGPGPGAPQTAAGLDDGRYVFQITDPPGKRLLSSDAANCRQFDVSGGIIVAVVPTGCQHVTGSDVDHHAVTVQLFPYADTPNHGGVYKVWVTRVENYLLGCSQLGVANGLSVVDCGDAPADHHGFIPSYSKTDNFKVKNTRLIREIDTRYWLDSNRDGVWNNDEPVFTGLRVIWTDTQGVQNTKYTYFVSFWNTIEAHVEAVEEGRHYITIPDQSAQGCTVGAIFVDDTLVAVGPNNTVAIDIDFNGGDKVVSRWVKVACRP